MEASKFTNNLPADSLIPLEVVEETPMRMSKDIGELAAALAKAQLGFKPVLKESENPAFKRDGKNSRYADLFSLVSATRESLAKEGLVIIQSPSVRGKVLVMTSTLAHSSGQWMSHELSMPAADDRGFTAHSIGKAMTYARRYSWQCLTGAVAEEDDDGNEASGVGSTAAAQDVAKRKVSELEAKKANGSVPKAQIPAGPIEASPKLNLPPVPPPAAPEPESKSGEDIDYIQGIVKRVVDKQTKDKRLYKEVGILDPFDRSLTLCSFDNFQLSDGRFWQYLTPSIVDEVATFVVARREKNGKAYHNIINVEMIGNHKWENGVGTMDRANS